MYIGSVTLLCGHVVWGTGADSILQGLCKLLYHNKSEKVQVQGTTVVAGAAEAEYTGERALFPGKYCLRISHL